jgi:hypothetical protein
VGEYKLTYGIVMGILPISVAMHGERIEAGYTLRTLPPPQRGANRRDGLGEVFLICPVFCVYRVSRTKRP